MCVYVSVLYCGTHIRRSQSISLFCICTNMWKSIASADIFIKQFSTYCRLQRLTYSLMNSLSFGVHVPYNDYCFVQSVVTFSCSFCLTLPHTLLSYLSISQAHYTQCTESTECSCAIRAECARFAQLFRHCSGSMANPRQFQHIKL